jgi:energy-coupling factor transporter ATP-binding protein EcfA2
MNVYVVKISNGEIIKNILNQQQFTHDGINLFESEISVGDPVFIYFGGDKAQVSWETGLAAVGRIVKSPYDKGYSKNNFKIDIIPLHILPKPIPQKESKLHDKLRWLLWDAPYFGANHFPTQAIQKMHTEEATYASGKLYSEWAPDSVPTLKSLGVYDSSKLPNYQVSGSPPRVLPVKTLDDIEEKFLFDATSSNLKISIETIRRLISSLISKRFTILTGLSGSGKTKLAHAFAAWIDSNSSSSDPFKPGSKITSDRVTYYVNNSDRLSVEFWNNENLEETTIVTLPRKMISEWAEYIVANALTRDVTARQLREAVSKTSKYSPQLHSFETHLKAAAFSLCDSLTSAEYKPCYKIVPVGADWTSNENIVGYQDALQPAIYRKPASGALELILRAANDLERPYFLILDEMNLSHVERYFADILSTIEDAGIEISLHSASHNLSTGEDNSLTVPPKLALPENLFIIGTVNIDETTYMFSPKVLDRANVIEFRVSDDEMKSFLENPVKPDLNSLAGQGAQYARAFTEAAKQKNNPLDGTTRERVSGVLMEFFPQLKEAGAEFSYRTAHEICRFVYFHKELTGDGWEFYAALDAAIMQKLLPKLHGSKKKLGPVLEKMNGLCGERFPVSSEKIGRMQKRLAESGFTSFAEA